MDGLYDEYLFFDKVLTSAEMNNIAKASFA
jgi:hypothetical protein